MNPLVETWLVATAAVAVWVGAYGLCRLLTRPMRIGEGPATQDFPGPEPPAVVSLLANRWLPALTFRNSNEVQGWSKRLAAKVVVDARRRGLSRRRFGPAVVATLSMLAFLPSIAIGMALAYGAESRDGTEAGGRVVLLVIVTFLALCLFSGIAARYPGERDTPAGREAAARWLGLRAWLAGHEEFADRRTAVRTWVRAGTGCGCGTRAGAGGTAGRPASWSSAA